MNEPLKYILVISITAFLAAGVYIYKPISKGVDALTVSMPCNEPFRYSVSSMDSRFSISKEEVEEAALAAAALWNQANGRQLLIANNDPEEKSNIVIQLVYDERQERTDRELRFREQIRSEQIRLDREQSNHDRKRDLFDEKSEDYLELAEKTSRDLKELNEWVKERNNDGGFTENELELFERRKTDTERGQQAVRQQRQDLDTMARSINYEMDELNDAYADHNELIDQYNEEFAGDLHFTKATFQKAAGGGVITVNQFMNKKELVLILAHEMGHALGINHLGTPQSVMYSRMGAQRLNPVLQLSGADASAARQICS